MGPKWTEVDLIGLNSNCLIFKENKLYIILQLQLQNSYLVPRIAWVCNQYNLKANHKKKLTTLTNQFSNYHSLLQTPDGTERLGGFGISTVPSSISTTFFIEGRSAGSSRMHHSVTLVILSNCFLSTSPSFTSLPSSPHSKQWYAHSSRIASFSGRLQSTFFR